MRVLLVVLSIVVFGCSEGSRPSRSSGKSTAGIRIRLAEDGAIEVSGLSGPAVRHLESDDFDRKTWEKLVVVHVDGDEELPPVLGERSLENGLVRFQPQFPLRPGIPYRVQWNGSVLPGSIAGADIERAVSLPTPKLERTTVVERVDPPGEELPENLLRIYVHFSAPMSRGRSYQHLQLLDANGDEVEDGFLELGEELWDGDGRRFTLLFDPGRIKRELRPRRELGPALEAKGTYTLVVAETWQDARGAELAKEFRRTFRVGPADAKRPDPQAWKLEPPAAGETDGPRIGFDERLDRPMTERMLSVHGPDGELRGRFEAADDARSVRFVPAEKWAAGTYELHVDPRLEDLAGNSVGQPFEIPIDGDEPASVDAEVVRVRFEVR